MRTGAFAGPWQRKLVLLDLEGRCRCTFAMNLTCTNEAGTIDKLLEGIEDAVDVEVAYLQRPER